MKRVVFFSFIFVMLWAKQSIVAQEYNKIPYDDPEFNGKIGRTYKESKADWPELPSPPSGAPNVIVILLDDVGFGMTSTFGGSISTPALDRLASRGLRYNCFHTCGVGAPTRAALLTGRNHHTSGNGFLVEWATGFPSYNNMMPRSTATIGKVLKYNGINTAWFGKNNNTPEWECSATGPFDRWPTNIGFDYFYGFNGNKTSQYYPEIFENTIPVEPDRTPEEGYHLLTDMTDRAINWLHYQKSISPNKPVFMYFAPGAVHAPHHVAKEWTDRYRGKFDHGWDKEREVIYERQLKMGIIPEEAQLSSRNPEVPTWESRSEIEKKIYSRLYENFAGYLTFTDFEVGRLLDVIYSLPDADNTLIIYIVGDNGASSEGGLQGTLNIVKDFNNIGTPLEEKVETIKEIGSPETAPHFPVGWAFAGNTPFPWVKQIASHFGATRNPMVISWPKVIKDTGAIRAQFLHVIDIMPTILEACKIEMPDYVEGIEQKPIDGHSFYETFVNEKAEEVRVTQYFEVLSNRAVYDSGWVVAHQHTLPWKQSEASGYENELWELFNIKEDFSEAVDLAVEYPEKLEEMKRKFKEEASKYNVYPLDDRNKERIMISKPTALDDRKEFVFYKGAVRIPEIVAPKLVNHSWSIECFVETSKKAKDGVLFAIGGVSAGMTLFVKDGFPVFVYNLFGSEIIKTKSKDKIPDGSASVKLVFNYDGGGLGKGAIISLFINNEKVALDRLSTTVPIRFGTETFGIGEDSGASVTHRYMSPNKFMGNIIEVKVKYLDED